MFSPHAEVKWHTSAAPFATKLGAFVSANDRKSFENSESTANEGWTDITTSLAM